MIVTLLQQSRLSLMIELEQTSAQAILFSILGLGSISYFMNYKGNGLWSEMIKQKNSETMYLHGTFMALP